MTLTGPSDAVHAFMDKATGVPPCPGLPADPQSRAFEEKMRAESGPPPAIPLNFHGIVPLSPEYGQRDYTSFGYHHEALVWGVKWGAYKVEPPVVSPAGDRVTYEFTCAWGLPTKWLAAASRAWPTLTFYVSWGGEGPTRGRVIYSQGSAQFIHNKSYSEECEAYPDDDASLSEDANHDAYKAVEQAYVRSHDEWIAGLASEGEP